MSHHGFLLTMPLLVINMGAEMIYILQQRLQAQNVRQEKASKVLQDVIRTMLASSFVDELFRPQEMYTNSSTRQIFNKLAHSSIMRINETSMDKLYDLMTMGVKYQWICCNVPQQMVQNTYNHLTALSTISEGSEVMTLVENCKNLVKETYCNLSVGNWYLLHQQVKE
uniref:Uncharacterized protein n=1 Tax=Triparma pacifica TaxID=91992 RepID=A0A7S2QVI2_9STRA|mmetsp:Transcript_317/g.464  ORF Transcript_317/g.464 Transcript_317/m.464 type:complete len:168 (+) Transcript_317:123-626(+)